MYALTRPRMGGNYHRLAVVAPMPTATLDVNSTFARKPMMNGAQREAVREMKEAMTRGRRRPSRRNLLLRRLMFGKACGF